MVSMKRRIFTKRRILAIFLFPPASIVLYLLLLIFPNPLFAYEYRHGRIVIRSDEPVPASAESVLREAERRLATSPLNQASRQRWIYICNRPWRFLLFANVRYSVGGLTYPPLSNNIFLRRVQIEQNRLIGPSGAPVPGVRTLSYFIAHEIAHTLIADRLGAVGYSKLASWKDEGYSDYVAKGRDFSYDDALRRMRAGDQDLAPVRSGLYLRYHLLVAHLLEKKGVSVSELLENDFDSSAIEREMIAPQGVKRESP
jgi:hypothetical protein